VVNSSRFSVLSVAWLLMVALLWPGAAVFAAKVSLDASHWGLAEGKECVSCHEKTSAGLTAQWQQSAHARAGVNCLDCHQADAADEDAITHEGYSIAVIVTPKDCGRCHEVEFRQNTGSVHASARQSLAGKRGAERIQAAGGGAVASAGCDQCHGSEVRIGGDGSLDSAGWPNSGIGRTHPDGSRGSCSACHGRHAFSSAQARDPAACTGCHSGPESPDGEVFAASRHGRAFGSHRQQMNLDADGWAAGKDYAAAPTCVSCHMGAAGRLPPTHDVGLRNAWKLDTPVAQRQHLLVFEDGDKRNLPVGGSLPARGSTSEKRDGSPGRVKMVVTAERRRKAMLMVCQECHGKNMVESAMQQYEAALARYNESYAIPAQAIMQGLYAQGLLTPAAFDEPLEHIYWQLWHDQGGRVRHGAAMHSARHVTQGFDRLGQIFHGDFLPRVKALGAAAEALIETHLAGSSDKAQPTAVQNQQEKSGE
jgi:hydroxylamine dehydrogenase